MKSGLKGGRADQELDEIAKSLLADESFLADDFEQMAHITTPIEAPMIPFAEFEKDGDTAKKKAAFNWASFSAGTNNTGYIAFMGSFYDDIVFRFYEPEPYSVG